MGNEQYCCKSKGSDLKPLGFQINFSSGNFNITLNNNAIPKSQDPIHYQLRLRTSKSQQLKPQEPIQCMMRQNFLRGQQIIIIFEIPVQSKNHRNYDYQFVITAGKSMSIQKKGNIIAAENVMRDIQISVNENKIRIKYDNNVTEDKKQLKFQLVLSEYRLNNQLPQEKFQVHQILQDKPNKKTVLIFIVKPSLKRRKYKYHLNLKILNETRTVLEGEFIEIKGIDQNHTNLRFNKNDNHQDFCSNDKIVTAFNNLNDIMNILVIGRVGQGKSTYLNYTLRMLNQVYGFIVDRYPVAADSDHTVTRKFTIYSCTHPSSQCKINFIDSPGIGSPENVTFLQYKQAYLAVFKELLNGTLDYDTFDISNLNNISTSSQDYDKLIHYCLVFVDVHSTSKEQVELIKECQTLLTRNQVQSGVVQNKADGFISWNDLYGQAINRFKQQVKKINYKVTQNHIFILSLKLDLFSDNNEFFHEYTRSVRFFLESAHDYSKKNIIKIYFRRMNQANYGFIDRMHIKRAQTMTLQDFINGKESLRKFDDNELFIGKDKSLPKNIIPDLNTILSKLTTMNNDTITIRLQVRKV